MKQRATPIPRASNLDVARNMVRELLALARDGRLTPAMADLFTERAIAAGHSWVRPADAADLPDHAPVTPRQLAEMFGVAETTVRVAKSRGRMNAYTVAQARQCFGRARGAATP